MPVIRTRSQVTTTRPSRSTADRVTHTRSPPTYRSISQVNLMRLGARLLLSVLLLTMYLPVAVVQATNGDTLVITGLSSTETVGVADLSLTVTDQTAGSAN